MTTKEAIYIEINDSLFDDLDDKLSQDFENIADAEDSTEELNALRNLAATIGSYVAAKRKIAEYKKFNIPSPTSVEIEEAAEIASEYGIAGEVSSVAYLNVTPKEIAFDEVMKLIYNK